MKLVIVESPAKVKTIKKYLGEGYKVAASMGHIIDLPKKELGVDTEKNFEPNYVVTNRKALKSLKDSFSKSDTLIIASDPDREGEAIGWHVAQQLGVVDKRGRIKPGQKLERIVFTSITKDAVQEAIKSPKGIDMDLINAQQARRVLDRIVGYKLSPLLWKKVRFGLSAGRVQSVAVRLIVDREEERDKFKADEYWRIYGDLSDKKTDKKCEILLFEKEETDQGKNRPEFSSIKFELIKIENKKTKVEDKATAEKILQEVDGKQWVVSYLNKHDAKRYPKPPFITSTLQRTASNIFGYPAKTTMRIAQRLYEAGLITYMRTDSFNIVKNELSKIRKFIGSTFGDNYLSLKEVFYRSRTMGAQEAHEAVRPTNIAKDSKGLGLKAQEAKLYDLIRNRVLACQMNPARLENTTIQVKIDKYLFEAKGQRVLFAGYLKAYPERVSENVLPEIRLKQKLYPIRIIGEQNFTSPPARYSEATLIRTLEKYGIGRPSTYAPIISTILARKYVIKDGKYFVPTETGKIVTKLLKKYFNEIVDTGFTADMERNLDDIAAGEDKWVEVIKKFYGPFIKEVEAGEKNISREEFTVIGDSKFKCPECGKKMVKKVGRFGIFLSCSDFPKCKGMRSEDGKTQEDQKKEVQKEAASSDFKGKYLPAPEASDGKKMILKSGRFGKFWAHPDYPKVKEAKPLMLKEKCPECGEPLVERKGKWGRTFIGCSGYPKCRYIKKTAKQRTAKQKAGGKRQKVSARGGPASGWKGKK